MHGLELVEVVVITPRHPLCAHDELDEEGGVETDKDKAEADTHQVLFEHTPRHLGPPIKETTEERHDGATHHRVVEVRHDEVRIVEVNVDRENTEEDPSEAADRKHPDKRQRVEHRRLQINGPLIKCHRPVDDFDCRGD